MRTEERELLKRVRDTLLGLKETHYDLYWDIQTALDLREDSREDLREDLREEPVAWCQLVEGKVQDLLTSFEMKDWIKDDSWAPLYTSPPKREPLSEQFISVANQSSLEVTRLAFRQGVRFAEKAHGIGGG